MGLKERIELKTGDASEMDVDAIINPINNDLILGGGLSGEIRRKGGAVIQEECNRLGAIPMGEAAVTPGGQLRAKWIIHAASMKLGGFSSPGDIQRACENSLKRAEEKGVKTLAMAPIGTGNSGFAPERSAQIMFEAIWKHLGAGSKIEKVLVVVLEPDVHLAFKAYYDVIKDGEPGSPLLLTGTPNLPMKSLEQYHRASPPRGTGPVGPRSGPRAPSGPPGTRPPGASPAPAVGARPPSGPPGNRPSGAPPPASGGRPPSSTNRRTPRPNRPRQG